MRNKITSLSGLIYKLRILFIVESKFVFVLMLHSSYFLKCNIEPNFTSFKNSAVVYFDQWVGAPHAFCWSKSFFYAKTSCPIYFPSNTGKKKTAPKKNFRFPFFFLSFFPFVKEKDVLTKRVHPRVI